MKKVFENKRIVIGLIALAVVAVGFYFWSGRNGRFLLTGNTIEPRAGHTATLLQDGRVLITGGEISGSSVIKTPSFYKILKSAEIYDPSTNKFTKTGDMTSPRVGHAAILLKDGRVLITGGAIDGKHTMEDLKSAEIYDPKTEKFTKINYMNHTWFSHHMVLLSDGRVLISGLGQNLEIFNPKINSFKNTTSCLTKACPENATLLSNGNVLFTGGFNFIEQKNFHPQVFNPNIEKFKYVGEINLNRSSSTATLLKNGDVVIIGYVFKSEIYNHKNEIFKISAKLNQQRHAHNSILLPSGKVLVVGGLTGQSESLRCIKSVELYDPQEDKFIKVGNMHYIRGYKPTLTLLKNGNVLIMGGKKRPELYISK